MRVTIEQIRDEISDRLEVVSVWITSRTDRRSRWIGSTVIVFGVHLLFFWVLMASNTQTMQLPPFQEEIYPVELFDIPPPLPEPIPEVEPVEPVPEVVEQVTPPEIEPEVETVPQPQPQTQPVPQPQPNVVEAPRKSLTVKPVDISDLTQKQSPTARTETQRDVQLVTSAAPKISAVPAPNLGVKKRNQDDQVSARTEETAKTDSSTHNVANLNLHVPDKVMANAPASGLAPAARKPAGGGGGGSNNAGLPPGTLQGLSGGRSGVSQAILNHNSCVEIQRSGKPIPENCNMKDMASMGKMGPKPDRDFQTAASKRDANLRYKTSPGSTEYWQRVNKSPTPGSGGRDDNLPKKGTYASDKDARVMEGANIDPINGN
ncbi:hypothetical protein [Asticcacaulis sp. AC402]|uniref:hypothetical protein n=1 Tax=Asticcacaulis sp. AC402 TaxID=1282361 RepID=UPI0003C3FC7F|nr:hypothetical protein [Asticcacaulis sp. AC402]ESQ76388.1 hypothetical protein ABAC402_04620 [Asticcacaulis sp. AC402]